jgi:prepilin-type N-terminal cleavage/methylation domain-containing protein
MKENTKHMTSRGAYTLIEILIVLALLCLIAAIAIPNLNIINSIKEKQELNELKRDLMYLRNKAIIENCYYEVHIDIKENRYRLGVNTHKSSVKSKIFESGLKFINASDTTDAVFKFSPSGSPSKSGNFIIQKRNGDKYRFTLVVTSGKINIVLIQ